MKKNPRMTTAKSLFVIALIIIFIAPIFFLIIQSITGQWSWPHLLPQTWSRRAWATIQSWAMIQSILISLSYSIATVLLSLILCYTPAAALVRGNLPNRPLLETFLMAPVMLPPITFTLGIHYVFIRLGLADRWLGVVLVLTSFTYPYMLRALIEGFEVMGENYNAVAKNIGAGKWRRIWEIELPLLVPAIMSGASVVFLAAFSDYYLVFLVGGGAVPGYSGYLFPFLSASDRPMAAVLILLFFVFPLFLFGLMEIAARSWYRKLGMEVKP